MELTVTLREPQRLGELFGPGDRFLRQVRDGLGVRIYARGGAVQILGEAPRVAAAAAVLEMMQDALRDQGVIDEQVVRNALLDIEDRNQAPDAARLSVFARDASIVPKTDGQRAYIEAMLKSDLVFCLGPAGTGKTYLAVAVAVHLLKVGSIKRVCLVRPAVEAGEKLGFLPGDLQAKVNPYLRPIFDAMHDMMTYDQLRKFMVNDVVEVIPLAFMRGRTLNHSAIILDEAQNATPSQMLMFLTRLGHHSKMIVTGDDSQVDLDPGQPSGLVDAVSRLRGTPGIPILRLTEVDIVRHPLVSKIVVRYANNHPSSVRPRRSENNIDRDEPSAAADVSPHQD
jgi:phosphate starvation-inducible PhoH-like protein